MPILQESGVYVISDHEMTILQQDILCLASIPQVFYKRDDVTSSLHQLEKEVSSYIIV